MNDATKQGASADVDDAENQEGVDNAAQNRDDRRGADNPQRQREDIYEKFSRERNDRAEDIDDDDEDDDQDEAAKAAAAQAAAAVEDADEDDADPLADFVEVRDGKAYFKTLVDGQAMLVPMDRARAQLQKHEAADIRLQKASQTLKEAEQRASADDSSRRSPSTKDVSAEDDEAVMQEASDLIKALMDEDEETAAKKLAGALSKARSSGNAVDIEALTEQVATRAAERMSAQSWQEQVQEGFNGFLKVYGDTPVDTDPALRAYHSAKVDELVAANPDKGPGWAMLEAGKMTCEFAGLDVPGAASDTTTNDDTQQRQQQRSEQPDNPRQARKRELQPLPPQNSGRATVSKDEPKPQSAREALNEMRRARGQPVAGG